MPDTICTSRDSDSDSFSAARSDSPMAENLAASTRRYVNAACSRSGFTSSAVRMRRLSLRPRSNPRVVRSRSGDSSAPETPRHHSVP